jgi:hypothetical protein
MEKLTGIRIISLLVLWGTLLMAMLPAQAIVTMDVDSSVRSGTYVCPSVKDCVMMARYAEERGATQWCNSATIKRDGRVVWVKNYWPNRGITWDNIK